MAKFLHSDLGYQTRGDVLEVTLSSAANVRLLDPSNFHKYQRGETHRYYGGLARKSPFEYCLLSWGAMTGNRRAVTLSAFQVVG